ncbi:MAG: hypothetical protein O3A10_11560 [Chloroflexi bacterium]|nr:hypothetical protein [Chloroflexota bacterium]MDA1147155.1 hypothetical protein [Chloroflexota bacterium]
MTRASTLRSFALASLALLATLALAACTGDTEDTPTPTATATPEVTATAIPPAVVDTLTLPEGCSLFDEGYWEQPFTAGVAATIELATSPCGGAALAGAGRLRLEWRPLGFEDPVVTAVLTPATSTGRWSASVTFPEPGIWRADPRVGSASFFEVFSANDGLRRPYPDLPLPASPQNIVVLDAEGSAVLHRFSADWGRVGMLRNPDRVLFVRPRDGGARLVAADLATGSVEPLLDVASFVSIYSAPDGRAVAVEWGAPGSDVRHLALIDGTSGNITRHDDDQAGSAIRVAWSPDSRFLLAAGRQLRIFASDGSICAERVLSEADAAPLVLWAPNSRYALLHFFGQPTRIERIDTATLEPNATLNVSAAAMITALSAIAIAPSSTEIAIAWTVGAGEPFQLSVIPADRLDGAALTDWSVAAFDVIEGFGEFGGLAWSPDEGSIAFTAAGVIIEDSRPAPAVNAGSIVGVLDLSSGGARQVASSTEFYATYIKAPVWSADGRSLVALRFPCSGCGPPTSGVDVIDVAAGFILESFEDSWHVGPASAGAHLLVTPRGLLRTDGRDLHDLVLGAPGGNSFSAAVATLPTTAREGALIAVAMGTPRFQVLATPADGSNLDFLGTPAGVPVALLDSDHAVIRTEGGWSRVRLSDGRTEPYRASLDAPEKYDFVVSPSGALAIDLDNEGFAILDPSAPAASAIVPRRAIPGGVRGRAAWSPGERRIASSDTNALAVFDLDTNEEHLFSVDTLGLNPTGDEMLAPLWAVAWTPDGRLLLAMPGALWALDVDAGVATRLVDAPRPGAFTQGTRLAYSPDGGTLVVVTQFGAFVLSPNDAWRQIASLGGGTAGGTLRWAPDGSAIAYGADSGHVPQWIIVVPLDGSGAYRLVGGFASRVLGWLPDGRLVWIGVALGE